MHIVSIVVHQILMATLAHDRLCPRGCHNDTVREHSSLVSVVSADDKCIYRTGGRLHAKFPCDDGESNARWLPILDIDSSQFNCTPRSRTLGLESLTLFPMRSVRTELCYNILDLLKAANHKPLVLTNSAAVFQSHTTEEWPQYRPYSVAVC